MKPLRVISLNIWLPILVTLTIFILVTAMVFNQRNQLIENEIQSSIAFINNDLNVLTLEMKNELAHGHEFESQRTFSMRGLINEYKVFVLLDDEGRNTLSIQNDNVGQLAKTIFPNFDSTRYERALKTRQSEVHLNDEESFVTAYFPLELEPKSDEIRPSKMGVLFLVYDLSYSIDGVNREVWQSSQVFLAIGLASIILVLIFLKVYVSRPLHHLTLMTKQLAKGELGIENQLTGKGELLELADSFNSMSQQLEQKHALLKQSEERFCSLYDDNPAMLFTVDEIGTVLSVNQFGVEELGYPKDQLIGQSVLNVFYEDDKSLAQDYLKQCFSEPDKVHKWEIRKVCQDGSIIWVRETARLVKDVDGKTSVMIVCEDITEHNQAKKDLRSRTNQLINNQKTLFDLAKLDYSDEEQPFKQIIESDAKQLQVARVSIWLYNHDHTEMTCQALYQEGEISLKEAITMKAEQYPRYFHSLEQSMISASDARSDPRTNEATEDYLIPLGITSMLDVPIRLQGKMVGIVCHEHIGLKRKWSVEDEDFASSIADLCALIMSSAERKQAEEALNNVAVSFAALRGEDYFNKVSAYLADKLNVDYAFIGELVEEDKVRVLGGVGKGNVLEPFEYALINTPCNNVIGQSLCCYPSDVQKQFPDDFMLVEMNIDGYLGVPLFDSYGKALGIIVVMSERAIKNQRIAESTLNIFSDRASAEVQRKQADDLLIHQSTHDALTGLVNRREFERRTERLLSSVKQDKAEHALCYMDLDQFKVVNDTCGHAAGDEMLRQLSTMLQKVVRHRDTLARLGGDEFGVLMEHCSLDDAHRVATSLLEAIQNYQFAWEEHSFRVGVSIGLVPITESTTNLMELLIEADAACYMAKDTGRNRIHVYHTEDSEIAERHGEMQWVTRLQKALDENRFCLYAQSIVPLDNSTEKHYELLIRMIGDKGEMIPPGAFLPAAERYNLITQLDYWVIETVFSLLKENPEFQSQISFISINLSGQSLAEESVLDFIITQLGETGIDGEKICFEVTETAAISNMNTAIKFISKLKGLGCRFALDDFGSGLSSFAYLKNLPVDYLKIDGMFVKDIVDDPIDHAMVKSINEIGQVMGMKTIAEFVEDAEIKGMLREIGVNYAQGYGIHKPQPFDELLNRSNNVTDINKSKDDEYN